MGGEDERAHQASLIPASSKALTRRSKAYGQMAKTYAKGIEEDQPLSQQATQMHAAIEASRRQISESVVALKKEILDLPEEIKERAIDKGKDLAQDLSKQAKDFVEEKGTMAKDKAVGWVKDNPWKAVGICFAVGFYVGMD